MESMKSEANEAILPFLGGICRYGSKAGSLTYKLKASTNHPFRPKLRTLVPGSQVPEDVNCVYEIVVNGLTVEAIKKAMGKVQRLPRAWLALSGFQQATIVESWVRTRPF